MTRTFLRTCCLAIAMVAGLSATQKSAAAQGVNELCKDVLTGSLATPSTGDVGDSDICNLVIGIKERQPDTLNQTLAKFIERDNGFAFLKDIDFKLKLFEVKDANSALGFSYDYKKTKTLEDYKYSADSDVTLGWVWQISAKGNVAFDRAANPRDFLDTRIAFSGFRNNGGITAVSDKEVFKKLNDIEKELSNVTSEEELAKADFFKPFREGLGLQTYVDLNINAGLESDQSFSQRQWTYGPQIALEIKSYDRSSWVSKANIIDYPFAMLRMLTGYDGEKEFLVYGWTYPTIIVGFDQVEPVENDGRAALGEKGKFDRYRAEVYFRTPFAHVKGSEIFFNFDYRLYRERNPPGSIEAAGLNEYSYRVLSITSDKGVYVSYAKGKLPLDLASQQVYEVGWKFNF